MLSQEQQSALALLNRERTEENLWNCVVRFQNETFKTMSGLFFTYELKRGRDGEYTKELWVTTFWRIGTDFRCVRFCLDCHTCFAKFMEFFTDSGCSRCRNRCGSGWQSEKFDSTY